MVSSLNSNLANYALLTQITNPNLLDNPWFTVNQRGQSSYTNSSGGIYTVDRWRLSNVNNDATLTVNSDGSVTVTGGTSTAFVEDSFDKNTFPFEFYKGKTITVSALYGDGTLKSATKIVPNDADTDWQLATELLYDSAIGGVRFYYRHAYNSPLFAQIEAFSGKSVTVKAVKVELGSVSTLAMDTAPNYATELLKCQRYYHIYATESLRPSNMYDCVPVMASTPSQGTITIDSTTYYYNSADL